MHSSHDRDNYIRVNKANVRPEMIKNFDRYSNTYVSHLGTKYDTGKLSFMNT